jgi:hypothetical protein
MSAPLASAPKYIEPAGFLVRRDSGMVTAARSSDSSRTRGRRKRISGTLSAANVQSRAVALS